MYKFVVKQPIKTIDNKTFGNELLFNIEDELYNQSNDYSAAEAISTILTQNSDKIDRSLLSFMTFTPNLLFKNIPKMFNNNELVIQIEDNVVVHPFAQAIVKKYKEAGYKIAINEFQFLPRYFAFIDLVDFVKINVKELSENSIDVIVRMAKGFNKICIATNIETKEIYDCAKKFEFDYFEGPYIAEAGFVKANKITYLKSNFFQLILAVTKDIPDVDEIQEIIERDASLTYEILRMVNSVHFALRQKTASVKQAIMILGIEQLKRVVYLLSFNDGDSSKNEDILKVSLFRATFCSELLKRAKNITISKSDAYLMGMLSTLDMMVDATMEEIIREIPVEEEIKEALIKHKGKCGQLLDLVLGYEKAEWDKVSKCAEAIEIPLDSIAQIYFDCTEEVDKVWKDLQLSKFDDEEIANKKEKGLV